MHGGRCCFYCGGSNHFCAPLTLQLTSRASRTAARSLYASLGFTMKDTGFFTLKIIGNR